MLANLVREVEKSGHDRPSFSESGSTAGILVARVAGGATLRGPVRVSRADLRLDWRPGNGDEELEALRIAGAETDHDTRPDSESDGVGARRRARELVVPQASSSSH